MKFCLIVMSLVFAAVNLLSCVDAVENPSANSVSAERALGASIVKQHCVVCHSQGINGAPIIGNKKMWSKRAPQGLAVLTAHAIEGYELMPAKGGKTFLSDAEVAEAVKYMLSQVDQ